MDAPKKYIRTYASDIAMVQRGGVPDLAPLAPSVPAPVVQAPPPATTPPPVVPPEPSEPVPGVLPALNHDARVADTPGSPVSEHPEALVTTYEQGMREAATRTEATLATTPAAQEWQERDAERNATLERLRNKARGMGLPTESQQISPPPYVIHEDIVVSAPQPVPPAEPSPLPPVPAPSSPPASPPAEPPPPQVAPPPPIEPVRPPSGLHTYGSDFTDRVQTTRASRASILAVEQDAKRPPVAATPAATRDRRYVYAGIALLLVSSGGLYAAYAYYVATGPVTLAPTVSAPIVVDERETVSGTGSTLMLALEQSVGQPLPSGSVRLVYDPAATSSDASIFNNLQLSAPGTLLRNIDAAHSMAGVIQAKGEQNPFFIISVSPFGVTFAGMLLWETGILRSLARLYPPYPAAVATTSVVMTVPKEGFVDEVVANHDTRIYRDSAGRSVLMYGYWDQKTLIIARDEVAFAAILDRLATSRKY